MIKLYLDENVPEAIAKGLKLRGFDVITVKGANRKGLSDSEQLKHASSENRAIFTFNVADFNKTHNEFINKGIPHEGIIVSKQLPIGIIINALSRLVSNINNNNLRNNIIWLSDWIE